MRVVFWSLVLVGAVLLALFAVSNREVVSLGLWPLPFLVELPLYLLMLVALVAGFVFGRLAGWVGARHRRRERRRRNRHIAALERELAATQADATPTVEPAIGTAALPLSRPG